MRRSRDMRKGILLPHLNRVGEYKSGNPRWYFRPKGVKGIVLPDLPRTDPAWLASYAKAAGVKRSSPVIKGTLSSAVVEYMESDHYKLLGPLTRDTRRRLLDGIRETFGSVKELTPDIIRTNLSNYKGHAQHSQLKMWRGFCKYLMHTGAIKVNPSKEMERAPVKQSDGHEPWTDWDISRFRAHYALHTAERLTFELLYFTGAAMVDAVKLGPSKLSDGGWLSYKRQKTGGLVEIPFDREFPHFARSFAEDLTYLKQAIQASPHRHTTWMVTQYGTSRSVKAASSWFSRKAKAAGIENKTAHGLRKSRDMLIAENEGTPTQCQSWLGHETLEEASRYTKKFDRRKALTVQK